MFLSSVQKGTGQSFQADGIFRSTNIFVIDPLPSSKKNTARETEICVGYLFDTFDDTL